MPRVVAQGANLDPEKHRERAVPKVAVPLVVGANPKLQVIGVAAVAEPGHKTAAVPVRQNNNPKIPQTQRAFPAANQNHKRMEAAPPQRNKPPPKNAKNSPATLNRPYPPRSA